MKFFLNNVETNKKLFTVNDGLNYGRFFDKKTKIYEIQLSRKEIIDLIEHNYNLVRNDIKQDDDLYNDTSEFTNTNYCSLLELLNYELDFEKIIKTYLNITLLKKITSEITEKKYIINSTDSIKIKNNIISIKGRVFEFQEVSS